MSARSETPSVVFFDTEDDSRGNFVLGVSWTLGTDNPKIHRTAESMREEIKRHRIAVAHNALYDLGNLFCFDEVVVFWAGGVFVKAIITDSGTVVRDSFRLLPASVATLGKSVGLEKLDRTGGDLVEYCVRDVEIIMRAMTGMFRLAHEFGVRPAWTIAGLAYRIWRKSYDGPEVGLADEFSAPARAAYYGGRVECFRLGRIDEKVWIYDVNSMYPSSMLRPLPRWFELRERSRWNGEPGIVEAEVESDLPVPVLPVRRKDGLLFPNGRFSGIWSSFELGRFLQEGGKIVRVKRAWTSLGTISGIFDDYVDEFFRRKRTEKDPFRRLVWKLLLNSLYGRFGIKGRMSVVKRVDESCLGKDIPLLELKTGLYMVKDVGSTPEFSNPLIAGTITAHARLRLFDGLKAAGKDAVYCDTDSVVSTADLSGRIAVGDGLGEWGLEMSADGAEIIAPKVYRAGEKVRAKGFKVKTVTDFETLVSEKRFTEERPVKWRTAMRTGKRLNEWKKIEKNLTSRYDKRILLSDGRTEPLVLRETG